MIVLESGDKLRGDASAATVVDFTVHGIIGSTPTQVADGQLAATIGDLYTSAAIVIVASITLVNTDTVARTVNLYLTPSGGTARRLIAKNLSLVAGYSLMFDGTKFEVIDTYGQICTTRTSALIGPAASTDNAIVRFDGTTGKLAQDSTGISVDDSGNLIFAGTQKIIGGTATTADLTLQTTSGVGASGADMHFLVGNAGATEAMTILNSGHVGIGQVSPSAKLDIVATDAENQVALEVNQLDTGSATAASITNAGTGDGLFIDQNGNGVGLHIDNDGTANSLTVEGTTATDFTIAKSGAINIASTLTVGGTLTLGNSIIKEIQSGSGAPTGTGTYLDYIVTFANAFASTPNITITSIDHRFICGVISPLTTGFTIRIGRGTEADITSFSGAVTCYWQAIL